MDALVSVSAVTNDHDVNALRRLYDVIESNVRSLKGLEVPAESYGRLLVPVIMSKLPSELRLILGREMGDEDWNLEVILENLGKEVETRERTSSAGLMSKRPLREQATAAALLSRDGEPYCAFCSQQHESVNCKVKKTPEDRKQALRRSGRCFVCLRRGHIVRDCSARHRCSRQASSSYMHRGC